MTKAQVLTELRNYDSRCGISIDTVIRIVALLTTDHDAQVAKQLIDMDIENA